MNETVFISSTIGGFEAVRQAAREAVESVGMRPVMAEMAGARPQSPQHALLAEVAAADIYLLLLGARYGEPGASGVSPTEEEFQEAQRRAKPIVILRQDVAMEPNQQEFLSRAGGGWEEGILWDKFTDERDVGMKVVRALMNVREIGDTRTLAPQAQARALELARGGPETGYGYGLGGSQARIVVVPLTATALLDELALDDASLPDRVSELARSCGLVSQASGIEQEITKTGITLSAGSQHGGSVEVRISLGSSGQVVVQASVAGDDPHFGTSRIDPERLSALIERTGRYATRVWRHIDPRGQVQQAALVVGIPDAGMKVYGRPKAPSTSISLGGMTRIQGTVVAPEEPLVVRRVDVESDEVRRRLVAAVRRVFADAGSIEEGS